MATVIPPGRNPIVQAAFDGLRRDERHAKKRQETYRTKPLDKLPAAKSNPKPAKAKKGQR